MVWDIFTVSGAIVLAALAVTIYVTRKSAHRNR